MILKKTLLILARSKNTLFLMITVTIIFWAVGLGLFSVTQALSKLPNDLKNGKFVIDPGHGGVDGGTNFLEKEVNLEVAKKLQSVLAKRGAEVILTREGDTSPGNTGPAVKRYNYRRALETRVVIIDKHKPDVFLSVHVNASYGRSMTSGAIVYYNETSPNAGLLSEILQIHLNMVTKKHGFQGHKPKSADFYILRNTTAVGAVVEIGFMTNSQEKELLKQDHYQWELAEAMAEGLNEYLAKREP